MKIGIITHYYKSTNYGGNLQAYALCKAINKLGHQAEQINFKYNVVSLIGDTSKKIEGNKIINFCKKVKEYIVYKTIYFLTIKKMNQINTIRNDAMLEFNQNIIPHCEEVYSSDNIRDCGEEYDAFITGSDQVWNPVWYNSAYYLDFVPSNKIKMSYAASLGKTSISDEQIEIFKNNLADYTAVGVRELDAVSFLQPYSPVPVAWNLDPTLLLDADEWDEICGERVINEKYVFCYFLGADKNQRNVAKKFAKKNKLKLVTIPFVAGVFEGCDVNFGDYKLYDASPEKFISLIKYAEYIFTDSFHATVFSSIYRKQYFVFQRAGEKGMGTRIYSLMKLFESEERFLDTYEKATLSYIESLSALTYNHELELFNEMKRNSFNYLRENLENKDITIEN